MLTTSAPRHKGQLIASVFRAAMLPSFLLPLVAVTAVVTSSVYSRPQSTRLFDDEPWSPEHRGLDTVLQTVANNYKATTNADDKLYPVKRSSLFDIRREMKRVNRITDDQLFPVKRSYLYDIRRTMKRLAFRGPLEVRWWWEKVPATPAPEVPRWPILLVPRFGRR